MRLSKKPHQNILGSSLLLAGAIIACLVVAVVVFTLWLRPNLASSPPTSNDQNAPAKLEYDWSEERYYDFTLNITTNGNQTIELTGTNTIKPNHEDVKNIQYIDPDSGRRISSVPKTVNYSCKYMTKAGITHGGTATAVVNNHGILGMEEKSLSSMLVSSNVSIHLQRMSEIGIEQLPANGEDNWENRGVYLLAKSQVPSDLRYDTSNSNKIEVNFLGKIRRLPFNFDVNKANTLFPPPFGANVEFTRMLSIENYSIDSVSDNRITVEKSYSARPLALDHAPKLERIDSRYTGKFVFDTNKKCLVSGVYTGTTDFQFEGKAQNGSFTLTFKLTDTNAAKKRVADKKRFHENFKSQRARKESIKTEKLDQYDPKK